jgi:autotransporter-associated beta strand protein
VIGNIVDNAALVVNRSDTLTLGGVISDTGSLRQAGAGTLVLTGDNTYSGGTTISAGTLQLGNGGTTGSVIGNITDNAALAVNRGDTFTLDGVISGTGSLTQAGPGTLVLTGNNTYSGTTTMTGGILSIGGVGNPGSTSGLIFNGGNLLTTANIDTALPVSMAGNGTIDNGGKVDTFSGVISGTGALTSTGGGTLILNRQQQRLYGSGHGKCRGSLCKRLRWVGCGRKRSDARRERTSGKHHAERRHPGSGQRAAYRRDADGKFAHLEFRNTSQFRNTSL